MKTLLTLFTVLFTTFNCLSQTLIRWDFDINGLYTQLPTYVCDDILGYPVTYSGIFPFSTGYTNGVSNNENDFSIINRGWTQSFEWDPSDFYQFSFLTDSNTLTIVDSVSLWWKKSASGPKVIHLRSNINGYGIVLDSLVSVDEISTPWQKWTIELDSFSTITQQITFRLYGNGSFSSSLGTLAVDSVAIYGEVLPVKEVQTKVFLSGPWNGVDMDDDLRAQGLIPLTDPYGFGKTINSSVLSITGSNAIVDWVILELRESTDSSIVSREEPFLLQRDGDVVALDGLGSPSFYLNDSEYFVSVRHRNHLGVMTAEPVNDSTLVDFTDTTTMVFGLNPQRISGGVALLWEGDTGGDGVVKYTGTGNDRDLVLQSVGGTTPNNVISGVYALKDANLDGNIKYTGTGNDRDHILTVVGGTTPNAVREEQVP